MRVHKISTTTRQQKVLTIRPPKTPSIEILLQLSKYVSTENFDLAKFDGDSRMPRPEQTLNPPPPASAVIENSFVLLARPKSECLPVPGAAHVVQANMARRAPVCVHGIGPLASPPAPSRPRAAAVSGHHRPGSRGLGSYEQKLHLSVASVSPSYAWQSLSQSHTRIHW
jgi:hypothetical protein